MSIEIRPTAVLTQINNKAAYVNCMRDEIARLLRIVRQFIGSADLQGASFDSARSHFAEYEVLMNGILLSLNKTRTKDRAVTAALRRFDGMGSVSEAEWLKKKEEAESRVRYYDQKLDNARRNQHLNPFSEIYNTLCISSYQGKRDQWQSNANLAGEMLSKIYSYCSETNNLYQDDLGRLNASIAAGISAVNAAFDPVTRSWRKVDSAWRNEIDSQLVDGSPDSLLVLSLDGIVIGPNGDLVYYDGRCFNLSKSDDLFELETLLKDAAEITVDELFDAAAYLIGEADPLTIPGTAGEPDIEITKYAKRGFKGTGLVISGIFFATEASKTYSTTYDQTAGTEDEKRSKAESAVAKSAIAEASGIAAGAAAGAATGALIGSFVPVAGTAIGAVIGGVIGGIGGSMAADIIFDADYDDNGKTMGDSFDDWWQDAFHGTAESAW